VSYFSESHSVLCIFEIKCVNKKKLVLDQGNCLQPCMFDDVNTKSPLTVSICFIFN
jgi:hypothetical protein